MKKVMILSAVSLMLSLATPPLAEAMSLKSENSIMQEQEVKYQEITVADIPEAVSATLTKDYADYTVDKAFRGDDGTYKVAVSKGDVKGVLFFNDKGLFLKSEKPTPVK